MPTKSAAGEGTASEVGNSVKAAFVAKTKIVLDDVTCVTEGTLAASVSVTKTTTVSTTVTVEVGLERAG